MKLRVLFITLAMAAVFAFTACGSSQEAAQPPEVSESSQAEAASVNEDSEKTQTASGKSEASSEGTAEASSEEAAETSSESAGTEETAEPATEAAGALQPGRYNLVGMTQDGETISTQDLVTMEELGFVMYIELKDDGTGVLSLYGEETEVTWDDKTITSDGDSQEYTWDGKYLILAQEETSITFSTMTAQEVIDAGEGVEGTMSFFEGSDGEPIDISAEPTVDVSIVGADWVKNYEDKDILVVWFDITNISEDYVFASWDAYTTVTQDGAEVGDGYIDEEEVPETANLYRSLRPGVTLRCANTFEANKDGGMIEYKVTSGLNDTEILTAELDPAALPGAPTDEFVLEKIDTIDWLDGAVESGTYADAAEVSFKNYEVVDGSDGTKILRVWFTYKNIGEEAASFFTSVNLRAVQDGISLNSGYISGEDKDAELKEQDVAPGESLDVCMDYELLSDSPVAVELITYGEGDLIAKAIEVK